MQKKLEETIKIKKVRNNKRMKEHLGEFEKLKNVKNKIKALEKQLEKIAETEEEKKEIDEREKLMILEIRIRKGAELEELEILFRA